MSRHQNLSASHIHAILNHFRPATAMCLAALAAALSATLPAQVQNRCSSANALQELGNQTSRRPHIDPTGRWVVFGSDATNLVWNDLNGRRDVFVKDHGTGLIDRLSIGPLGEANDDSSEPRISGTGRWVVYASKANNLSPFDPNHGSDIYLADRLLQTTTLVSTNHLGIAGTGESFRPSISDDGRYVAFQSLATNLIPGGVQNQGYSQVYVKDVLTGAVVLASHTPLGAAGNRDSWLARISRSGQFVVFESNARDLLPGDTNNHTDIYTFDRTTGNVWRSSLGPGGVEPNGDCRFPDIDEFGQTVCYESFATNLVPGTVGLQVFVTDVIGSYTECPNRTAAGALGNDSSLEITVAGRGRYVAFCTRADDVVPGDTSHLEDIAVRDRVTGITWRGSVAADGGSPNGWCQWPALSDDGRFTAYVSPAPNLLPGKVFAIWDVVRADLHAPAVASVAFGGAGCPSSNGAVSSFAEVAGELPWLGFDFHLHGQNAPSAIGMVVLGTSNQSWNAAPLPLPLDAVGMPGCTLFTSVDLSFFVFAAAVGTYDLTLPIPNDPAFRGVTLHAQTWLADPGFNAFGGVMSDALDFTIGG
ncbi:MAG: TolB family protein [Planctomycetota bacterium]